MALIISILMSFSTIVPDMVWDFGSKSDAKDWSIVNDGVMGGLSKGRVEFTDSSLIFKGSVSLENNGGFTSFRSPYRNYNFSEFESIEIRYRSNGLPSAFTFDNYRAFWRPNYKIKLPVSEDWQILKVKVSDIKQYRMGEYTGYSLDMEDAKEVIRVGLISDAKEAGDFSIEIDYIKFYSSN